ncbi:hypothetical protein [Plantibacter sp. T3]|uniref:hypothetical protein n=1 Tax=Plantibacter sp. T3 TaxID=2653161 RepID=UPI0012F157F7|nr:hypothetical protein [Plantibacter sp. T3]VXB04811.1 conserved hypothetical protein [Plantibacter sp. T3]
MLNPSTRHGASAESWTLTGALSPRPTVRVAAVDAYGDVLNTYTGWQRITGTEPARPWAVYLAGRDGLFRLLCFDLDAKTPGAAAAAARDADVLAGLLVDVGLQPVVCASGPSGGRHVWAALAEGVDERAAAELARFAKHVCPTLDTSQLNNAATGCVRPPGAPHRAGGHSTVLSGELRTLTEPTGTVAQVRALTQRLARLVDDAEPAHTIDPHKPLPLDDHSRLFLPGPRRELAAVSAAALREDAAHGDASAILWRVLIGAVAARWRHADVAALVDTAPGLEHVRSYRDGGTRRTRGRTDAARVLRRQWDKAVKFVATTDRQIGDDPTFDRRAGAIAAHVRELQARADASAGRWTRGGGPADRRILDVLCLITLQALSAAVEADTRRLALLAGVGRETARTALLRLSDDGWIAHVRAADGPHGAHWTIDPAQVIPNSQSDVGHKRTRAPQGPGPQDQLPPMTTGAAERTSLLATLTDRTTAAAHDLFTLGRPALGHHAGNTYARTSSEPQTLDDLSRATGASFTRTALTLDRLTSAGVLVRTAQGWRRTAVDRRRAAAVRAGVDGSLAQRAERYSIERELWAWWRAEDTWMRAPRRTSSKRRPGRGQLALVPEDGTNAYGPHPRRGDGRLDWREARRVVQDERGGVAQRAPVFDRTEPLDATEQMLSDLLGAVRIA